MASPGYWRNVDVRPTPGAPGGSSAPGLGMVLGAVDSAFGSPVKSANNYFFEGPANEIKQAYDQASGMSQDNAQKLKDFYMQQQAKAQGFYKPLQSMFNSSYGSGGIMAPQLPTKPLKSMYGGG